MFIVPYSFPPRHLIEIKSSDTVDVFVVKLLLKLNVNIAGTQNWNIRRISCSFERHEAEAKYACEILIKFRKTSEDEMTCYKTLLRSILILEH